MGKAWGGGGMSRRMGVATAHGVIHTIFFWGAEFPLRVAFMAKKPIPPKGRSAKVSKGGRPELRPTIDQRLIVEEMRFCGESEDTIAVALGISTPTLRKHFVVELRDGLANRRKEVTEMLFKAARSGNMTAIKRLDDMGRAAGARDRVMRRGEKPKAAPKAPELGKKEQRQEAAERVGGKFAVPAGPKLAIDNT